MLATLRKHASGWIAQVLIVLLVLSFAVWGVSDIFRGGLTSEKIATVGDVSIAANDFELTLENQRRQFPQGLNPAQQQMLGEAVLNQMVNNAAVADHAASLGLGLSDAALSRSVQADPTFHGANGQFNYDLFQTRIRNAGLTEAGYLADQRQREMEAQVQAAVAGGIAAPEAYLRARHEYENETRNIAYLVIDAAHAGTVPEPTPEQLTTFFESTKDDWRAPETRSLSILSLSPKDIADPSTVTDEEAQAAYEETRSRFTTPGTRHVWQAIFTDAAKAEAAIAAIGSGTSYDEAVRAQGATPVDLGTVSKTGLAYEAIADAAFALEDGATSGVVDGPFGPTLVHVTDVTPEAVRPFEEVKEEVKQREAEEKAALQIADMHDQIEDALAGGSTVAEAAASFELPLQTIAAVDINGNDADGNPVNGIPGRDRLLSEAFDSDVGLANPPIETARSSFVWFEVTNVTAEHDRPLDEVRERVVSAWKADQLEQLLDKRASELAARIRAGESIATIGDELQVTVHSATEIKRSTPVTPEQAPLSPDAVDAAFTGPDGTVTTASGSEPDTRIVLQVAGVTLPPYFSGATAAAEAEASFDRAIGADLFDQYLGDVRDRLGVSYNPTAMQRILGTARPG